MKEEKDNSQVYNYALISTHSNFLLKISKWMSSRHFKPNIPQTELLFSPTP